jgi:hypothetical protein
MGPRFDPEQPMPEKPMSVEPNHPEVLTTSANDLEAAPLFAALEELGIEATSTGSFTADFRAEAPGRVRIVVKHEDLARARKVLEEIGEANSDIDWFQVDVGEPE